MKLFRGFIKFLFNHLLYRVKYNGGENIKEDTTYLVCANHVAWADPFFIWNKIPGLNIMAKEELFKNKLIGRIFRKFGVFPIARGKKDFSHVLVAVKILKKNHSLLVFPEGTRKAKQKGIKAKKGAVFIAKEAEVSILPVYIEENYKLFRNVNIEFFKPIKINLTKEELKDKEALERETERVMKIIYKGEDL